MSLQDPDGAEAGPVEHKVVKPAGAVVVEGEGPIG
jgi:hypothetical protein